MTDVRETPTPHEVAAYLRRHPRFLSQFPDLALSLSVPRDDGQATSLASYQLEVLRDKNRELNRRLHELFANAQDNERLTVRTQQLTLSLMRANTAAATLRALVACLTEDFHSDLVRVLTYAPVAGAEHDEWLRVVPSDSPALAPFHAFIEAGEPLCGRIQHEKLEVLFGARADEVQSTALLPLGRFGVLAIASVDANRFYPGMGTLFLRLISEAAIAGLARYEQQHD